MAAGIPLVLDAVRRFTTVLHIAQLGLAVVQLATVDYGLAALWV